MAKNPFSIFLFLKVSVSHIPTGKKYFLVIPIFKVPVQHIPTGQEYFLGFLFFNQKKPRKYFWPVGICWTGTFKNKKP
jgi:hypothetical protein